MRKAIIVTLLLLSLRVSATAQESARIPDLPRVSITDLPAEVQDQVRQAYDRARAHPQDADASGKLGMLLDLYNRPEQAAVCYQRAHRLNPGEFKWLYYLGSLQARQGRSADASETFKAALRIRPDDVPVRLKLAESLLRTGDVDASRQIYAGIIKEFPDANAAAEAHWGLGRIAVARGNLDEARESFKRACELFPSYGAAHYELSQVDRKLGKDQEATEQLALYDQHRTLVPPLDDPLRDELRDLDRSAASLLERGVELEQAGRLTDAIATEEQSVQLDPKLVRAHANLIILYGRAGDFAKAEQHYRAALALAPGHVPDAYYNYGVVLVRQGKSDEAEKCFRSALGINPDYAEAHNDLGYLLERQGKLSDAAAEYRKAVEEKPGFRQAHFNLGRILVSENHYPEALHEFQQTLSPVDENTPAYLYALGAAYGRTGNRPEALRYLQQAKDQAAAHDQKQLEADIEKDLESLQK